MMIASARLFACEARLMLHDGNAVSGFRSSMTEDGGELSPGAMPRRDLDRAYAMRATRSKHVPPIRISSHSGKMQTGPSILKTIQASKKLQWSGENWAQKLAVPSVSPVHTNTDWPNSVSGLIVSISFRARVLRGKESRGYVLRSFRAIPNEVRQRMRIEAIIVSRRNRSCAY